MSDHTKAIVPLQAWAYQSPRLARTGARADIGLVAEALIYYDRVVMAIQRPEELEALVNRFAGEDLLEQLLELLRSGHLSMLHFAFQTTMVRPEKTGLWQALNVQFEDQVGPRSFEQTILNGARNLVVPHARKRAQIFEAVRRHVVEIKSDEYQGGIERAREDWANQDRAALLVQALMDDVYDLVGLRTPPEVQASVVQSPERTTTSWNIDLNAVGAHIGQSLEATTPFAAALAANRFIWAAGQQESDLYLGSPISRVAGDTLYEIASTAGRPQEIVSQLEGEVAFPDVHSLFTKRSISLKDVLHLRAKARRFRSWLQDEADRDRNAIFAYHEEVAKEAGFVRNAKKLLTLVSYVAPPSATVAATLLAPTDHRLIAAVATEGTGEFLADQARKWLEGWKPVMFGRWASGHIAGLVKARAARLKSLGVTPPQPDPRLPPKPGRSR